MSNFQQAFADEIHRLSRKEAKALTTPLAEQLASLKKRFAELEKKVKLLTANLPEAEKPAEKVAPAVSDKPIRLNGNAIKKIRTKLRLTQAQFAVLVDASTGSVNHWEAGKVIPQKSQKQKIAALRGLSKRAIIAMLAEKGITVKAAAPAAPATDAKAEETK
jgi:DNA-binding transcriptional regulator YiaG